MQRKLLPVTFVNCHAFSEAVLGEVSKREIFLSRERAHHIGNMDLLGFLDGTTPCPPETILTIWFYNAYSQSECKLWKRQDRLILHAILASVTWAVAPLISSATTSHEAWQKLETTFANQSRTRMLSLRNILMKTTKGSQSMLNTCRPSKSLPMILLSWGIL
ncbi:Retrovirus-related Pol polyprotein from transposon RE1 [Vitis vinifera]|uniref:Retrovirus-related Pol polyprotein from transposon RE1 n=1 Tax=Vitis vinifera TaxID=29760 RepID=A0A438BWT7_VITVI|nr:Retrovirus-related Pol polyprotein from transposon RE1 [Vitis vinifera]